jgi:hypothetical protein
MSSAQASGSIISLSNRIHAELPFKDKPKLVVASLMTSEGDDKGEKSSKTIGNGVLAASFYMSVSVILILFNKGTLSFYDFHYANVLTLTQVRVC